MCVIGTDKKLSSSSRLSSSVRFRVHPVFTLSPIFEHTKEAIIHRERCGQPLVSSAVPLPPLAENNRYAVRLRRAEGD